MTFSSQIYLLITLVCTAWIGDDFLKRFTTPLHKAFVDNFTHAEIGFIAWLIVSFNIKEAKYVNSWHMLADALLCMVIASLIDLDHFCAARSIRLEDATSLKERPFLHLSTIPVVITIALLGWAHWIHSVYLEKFAMILFVAFGTHHTRDAHRRGYWFAPFGSTPPLSYFLYMSITILIPYLVVLWWRFFRVSRKIVMTSNDNDMQLLLEV